MNNEYGYYRIFNTAGDKSSVLTKKECFMKKKFFKKDIDSLIQGVSTILSKNRCSLTDEEIALLQECMKQLKLQKKRPQIDWDVVLKIIATLCRLFIIFKDFQF